MSKLWLKSGHLVLEAGALVLCPECPCPTDTGTGSTGTTDTPGTGSTGTTGTGTEATGTGTGSTGTTGTSGTSGTGSTGTGSGTGSTGTPSTGTEITGTGTTGTVITGTGTEPSGTGTPGVGLWYCMDEFETVTDGNCFPCVTVPRYYRVEHNTPYWPNPLRLVRVGCLNWVQTRSNEISHLPYFPFGCDAIGINIGLRYIPIGHLFEFRIQSVHGSFASALTWTCPANEWDCLGPNTLTRGSPFGFFQYCTGFTIGTSITVYPD